MDGDGLTSTRQPACGHAGSNRKMKIIVALDSLKGSLDATNACKIIGATIHEVVPSAEIVLRPLADGGEGTAEILLSACGGEWIPVQAMGPLPHLQIDAGYAALARPDRIVVDMAEASGLTLLREDQRDPLRTTTFGTGELIADAFVKNRPVWLAVGGSATVDGGVGAAMALGWKFLDAKQNSIGFGGGQLEKIAKIIPPPQHAWPEVEVLCDVTNPLCGPNGAAKIFGPQKGATPTAVEKLERGLLHLAEIIHRDLGIDVLSLAGGGAAGGLGAGAVAFFGAKIKPGIATIIEAVGLRDELRDADWIITGEGSFDSQSLGGKVVSGVIAAAREAGVKVGVLAGRIGLDDDACRAAGIDATHALVTPLIQSDFAMTHVRELLAERAREFAVRNFAAGLRG